MATVKTHVRHIFAKLNLRDRAQAVVAARDAGLQDQSPGGAGMSEEAGTK